LLVAMVTVRAGREDKVAMDLMDALYPYDQEVKVSKTDFSGLLILRTSLNPKRLLDILRNKPIAHLYKVLPFNYYSSLDESSLGGELVRLLSRINLEWRKFLIKVKVRGNKEIDENALSLKLAKLVEEKLGKRGDLKKPELVIRVEVIGNDVGISIYRGNTFVNISGYRKRSIEKV